MKRKYKKTVQDILRKAREDNDEGRSLECGIRIDEAIAALDALYLRMKQICSR